MKDSSHPQSDIGFLRIGSSLGLPDRLRGGVVAIGNFDGVHRGHQAVLRKAFDLAQAEREPALALTFEPHPRSIFQPDVPLYRITPAPMKAALIAALGFDAVIEQAFTPDFSRLSADAFVKQILVEHLAIKHAVTGFDFHFGRGRQGGPAYLVEAGRRNSFGVAQVAAFNDEGGEVISSSRIREFLANGDVGSANELLGYRYTVGGRIIEGKKLGRKLGFPTANICLPAETGLKHGIYAVRLRRGDGSIHNGVASFGRRPTVETDGEPILETYIFDLDANLYGEECSVSLFGWLRGEERFESLDLLVAQMKRDAILARKLLSEARPLGELDRKVTF